MANKKINELVTRTPSLSDLILVGDPSSGYSYKATVTALATIIETDIADGFVTLSTTQTISGNKTFSAPIIIDNGTDGRISLSNTSAYNLIASYTSGTTNNKNLVFLGNAFEFSIGAVTLGNIANATIDTDKFLVSDSGVIKYRTGAEVLSDIGAASSSHISGTTNYIAKFTSSSAIGNSVIYESSGNIGIGTTTLTARLTVNGNAILSGSINAAETYLSSPNGLVFQINSTNANGGYAQFQTSSTTIGRIGTATQVVGSGGVSVFAISSVGANDFILGTNGTQRVIIDTSGNVTFSQIANATVDTDKFLVSDSGVIKYRTGAEVLSDIGGASSASISGTTNYIPKFTSSSAIGNSVIYDNSGSILIGTTTTNGFKFKVSDNGGAEFAFLPNDGGVNNFTNYNRSTSAYMPLLINALNQQFYISGNEQMRLTSTGLGIGTSSPNTLLSLVGNHASGQSILKIQSSTAYSSSGLSSIGFNDADGTRKGIIYVNSDGLQLETGTSTSILFNPNGNTKMILDASGNLGLGVTPSAWGSIFAGGVLQVKNSSLLGYLNNTYLSANAYFTNSSDNYIASDYATRYVQASGQHRWETAPSGTAGNAITFTQAMTLDASGRLAIGNTSPTERLDVTGVIISRVASGTGTLKINNSSVNKTWSIYPSTNGSQTDINFYEEGTAITALTLKSGGNVGIGTSSPSALLHVAGSGTPRIYLQDTDAGAGNVGITFLESTNGKWTLASVSGNFQFFNEATSSNALYITSTNNVGIGTTSPTQKLEVNGTIIGSNFYIPAGSAGTYGLADLSSAIQTYSGSVSPANTTIFYNGGSERMRITSVGDVLIGTTSAFSTAAGRGNISINGSSSSIVAIGAGGTRKGYFFTDGTNASLGADASLIFDSNNAERMRITSGGEVYIAGTTDQGAYNLQVNGTGVWGAGAYVNGSDIALKQNILPLDNSLELVKQMKPVTYTYKESYSKDDSIQTGFIAQDLQELLKEKNYLNGIVKQGPEYLNVAYQNLIPLLVKAIQEQQIEIENLKNK